MLVGISPVAIATKIDVLSTGDFTVGRANLHLVLPPRLETRFCFARKELGVLQ